MKIIGIDEGKNVIKKRELNKKKVLIAGIVGIVILIFLILFIIYSASKSFREVVDKYILMKNVVEDSTASISLEENENNNIFAYDKHITILNKNELINYNSSGKEEGRLTVEISNPLIATNGKYLLIAEKDKSKIYLVSGNQLIWQADLEGIINKITVNKNGYSAVVLSGTTHKSVIQTFDTEGNELFKTYLSKTTAMDIDISQDNQFLAFSEINSSGTNLQSTIKKVSIAKAKNTPSESIVYTYTDTEGKLLTNLKFQEGNKLVCMYDDGIYVVKGSEHEHLLNLVEEGKNITFGDIELSNNIYRVIEKSSLLSSQTSTEIMNTSTKKISTYRIDNAVKEMYSYDGKIALNLGSEVHFIGTNGWLIKKYISSQEIKKIVMCNDFAGIVYRNKIELVNI